MPANVNGLCLRRSRGGVVGTGRLRVRLAAGARDCSTKRPDRFCSSSGNLYSRYREGGGGGVADA